jgi:hypothetical protein
LKLEGTSPQAGSFDKSIVFHIGGYAGSSNALKNCAITFTQGLVVSNSKSPELKLKTNVNELFKNPSLYDFAFDYAITSPGMRSNGFANNYADMTTFEAIVP